MPCVYCGDEKKTREKEKKEMSVSNGTLLFEIFRIRKQKRKREEKGKRKKKTRLVVRFMAYIIDPFSYLYTFITRRVDI